MSGGIQRGTSATDSIARKIDNDVRTISKEVFQDIKNKYTELNYKTKLPKSLLLDGIGACSPDGGLWFYKEKLVAAFEAKKQGPRGNAIERWYKNCYMISEINKRIPLVTFAVGEGSKKDKPIYVALYAAHKGQYNVIRENGPSCFLSEYGFAKEFIRNTMINFIESEIRKIESK